MNQLIIFLSGVMAYFHLHVCAQQDYQQHHAQGPQSVKRASHKFNPYPYTGSKGHHQGSTGKKYPGKYQGAMEGTSSSGSYTGGF